MGIEWNEISAKSNGGTEMMGRRLERSLPAELLDQFQIILTRVNQLDESKYRILWIHDLPEDPSVAHLANEGWKKFHRLVFVSNWQMQRFIERFGIPWSKCIVMSNAIEPIAIPENIISQPQTDIADKDPETVRLVYHTTPHRGLSILLATFDKLLEKYSNLELHLFSSFELYGWGERDEQFKQLFDYAEMHEKIINHKTVTNEQIRRALPTMDIFAYPSIWQETSCLCLMEAMSAGLHCVHSNLGALFETGANWTSMYHLHEDLNEHAKLFYHVLENAIVLAHNEQMKSRLQMQKTYADVFYNWDMRAKYWQAFLESVVLSKESLGFPAEEFVYKV